MEGWVWILAGLGLNVKESSGREYHARGWFDKRVLDGFHENGYNRPREN